MTRVPRITRLTALLFISIALPLSQGKEAWNPFEFLETLANLPPLAQDLALIAAGATLQTQAGMDCNIFGGRSACKPLPLNSSYMQQCPGATPQAAQRVDCAFYASLLDNVYDNPADDVRGIVAKQSGEAAAAACPECFSKLQAMWCSLAAPACGTFHTYTQRLVLPALTAVVNAYNRSDGELEALAGAVNTTLGAVTAVLPCREMCEDLLSTCGCGGQQAETFGVLLQWMVQQAEKTGVPVPPAFQRTLFKSVWDKPFCDLFIPKTTRGFSGTCAYNGSATCPQRDAWCASGGGGGGPDLMRTIQGVLLLQLTRAMSGWIADDNTGLWRTRDALQGDADLRTKYVDNRFHDPIGGGSGAGGGLSGSQVAAVVFLSLLGAGLAAGGVLFGYRYLRAHRAERRYFELQAGNAFTNILDDGHDDDDDGEAGCSAPLVTTQSSAHR